MSVTAGRIRLYLEANVGDNPGLNNILVQTHDSNPEKTWRDNVLDYRFISGASSRPNCCARIFEQVYIKSDVKRNGRDIGSHSFIIQRNGNRHV
jgi:hypothetical protein